mmetsp:Transcript_42797/g.134879  ORF Transcript_42797/g.134879 Transcript_42797/m.134879 type:complete len:87 (+) Transcript_42797:1304-1564(+)
MPHRRKSISKVVTSHRTHLISSNLSSSSSPSLRSRLLVNFLLLLAAVQMQPVAKLQQGSGRSREGTRDQEEEEEEFSSRVSISTVS